MLIRNRSNYNLSAVEYVGGASFLGNSEFKKDSTYQFDGLAFGSKASVPDGYVSKGYVLPMVAGGMSSLVILESEASGDMCLGIDSSSDIQMSSYATADGILALSGEGSASSTVTVTGDAVNIVLGEGSAIGTSIAYSTMVLVYGYASGSCQSFSQCIADPTLILHGSGTTIDTSGLTPASIWNYQDRTLTALDVEVSGLTVEQATQLTKVEKLTGLIPALL